MSGDTPRIELPGEEMKNGHLLSLHWDQQKETENLVDQQRWKEDGNKELKFTRFSGRPIGQYGEKELEQFEHQIQVGLLKYDRRIVVVVIKY